MLRKVDGIFTVNEPRENVMAKYSDTCAIHEHYVSKTD